MRIYFVYPRISQPTGGLKQHRVMVERFLALGAEAFLLRQNDDFDDTHFYDIEVPFADFGWDNARNHLKPNDLVLIPEHRIIDWILLTRNWGCRVGVYSQNGYLSLDSREWAIQTRFGIELAITITPSISNIMRVFHGLDAKRIFEVPVLVTRDPFRLLSRSEIIGDLSVCYMPRKCTNDAFHIRKEVMKTFPDVPWVEIDKRPIREVAALLRSSKVFLSTQENEGFGLPAIEAMSCGCIVAGYSGTPGFPHPYATPSNGLWAKDRDAASAVRKTIEAIRIAREGGKAAQSIANAAWHTVRRFDVSSVDIALKEFLEVTSVQAYSARTQPRQAMSMATYVAAMKHLRRVGRLHFREQLRHIVRKIL